MLVVLDVVLVLGDLTFVAGGGSVHVVVRRVVECFGESMLTMKVFSILRLVCELHEGGRWSRDKSGVKRRPVDCPACRPRRMTSETAKTDLVEDPKQPLPPSAARATIGM